MGEVQDLYGQISQLLRDVQRMATMESYKHGSAEVAAQLKIMNATLTRLAARVDIELKPEKIIAECERDDCAWRGQIRLLKREVQILRDQHYFAHSHFLSGNLARILGLIDLANKALKAHNYKDLEQVKEMMGVEIEKLNVVVERIFETSGGQGPVEG
jgi:hypothetical protein